MQARLPHARVAASGSRPVELLWEWSKILRQARRYRQLPVPFPYRTPEHEPQNWQGDHWLTTAGNHQIFDPFGMGAPRGIVGTTPLQMLGNHSILSVQVDGIKGITQGIIKFPAVLVVIYGDGTLPDPKSFAFAVSFIILSILAFSPPGIVLRNLSIRRTDFLPARLV